jgi:hypothetical protein
VRSASVLVKRGESYLEAAKERLEAKI